MWYKKEEEKNCGKNLLKGLAVLGGISAFGYFIMKNRKKKPIMTFSKTYEKEENINLDSKEEKEDIEERVKRYFLVYQNNDYYEEKERGYIWARQSTDSGRIIFHWNNLSKIRKDDIVFSVVDRKIVSLNIARDNNFTYKLDGLDGYRVDLEYNELENPIDVDKYMDDILELSPDKYAPFNIMGRSNSGYLFDIGNKLGEYLLKIVKENNRP